MFNYRAVKKAFHFAYIQSKSQRKLTTMAGELTRPELFNSVYRLEDNDNVLAEYFFPGGRPANEISLDVAIKLGNNWAWIWRGGGDLRCQLATPSLLGKTALPGGQAIPGRSR